MTPIPPRPVAAALALCLVALTAGSALATETIGEGPRHGSRTTAADGTLVVYDRVSGSWMVPDLKLTYYVEPRYYRYENGIWLASTKVAGPWELCPSSDVPKVPSQRHGPVKTEVTAKLPSGIEAVFDPTLRVYKVAGHRGVFLFDAKFYRYDGGLWLSAPSETGPWSPASMKPLPPLLKKAVPVPQDGHEVKLATGETLVYHNKLKTFSLKDKPEITLFDGKFFEQRGEKWFTSAKSDAGFAETETEMVPLPVLAAHRKPGEGRAKDKAKLEGDAPKNAKADGDTPKKPGKGEKKPAPDKQPTTAE